MSRRSSSSAAALPPAQQAQRRRAEAVSLLAEAVLAVFLRELPGAGQGLKPSDSSGSSPSRSVISASPLSPPAAPETGTRAP